MSDEIAFPERCGACYGVGWTICVDQTRAVCFRCHGKGIEPSDAGLVSCEERGCDHT